MRVFISWSGPRSQALAQALYEWLPLVLHFVQPWLSQSDIEAGERWATEVAKELEASNFGIICVTRENVASPWILFEAGALTKLMQEGRVIPLLLDIEFREITGPLAQFQSKKVEKDGLRDVAVAINRLAKDPVPDARLTQLLDMAWSSFEQKVSSIPKATTPAKPNRPQQEILEELVTSIRGLDARMRDGPEDSRWRRRRFHPEMMHDMILRFSDRSDRSLSILMLASYFREQAPWLYELAVEVYRTSQYGQTKQSQMARKRLSRALKMLRHGPMGEMFNSPELSMLVHEFERFLHEPGNNSEPLDNDEPRSSSS